MDDPRIDAAPGSIAFDVRRAYLHWFDRLQALTTVPLDDDWWTGRYWEGLSPEDALKVGPDKYLPFEEPSSTDL